MIFDIKNGQTSVIIQVKLRDSTSTSGAGLKALTNASTGLRISTRADNEAVATSYTAAGALIDTIATLGTYAAPTATHCRFRELDATNHPGDYEIQLSDARFAVAGAKSLLLSISGATNLAEYDALILLRAVDPYDVNFGLSRLDAAITSRSTYAGGAVTLSPAGLDAVMVETGVNARQALSPILAACAAQLSGAGTGTIIVRAGANPATTRITATTDSAGNRTSVALNLPA
ncbi:MAG: hypothetical protein NVSMB9_28550 [Isosphaeraceae bacterium]